MEANPAPAKVEQQTGPMVRTEPSGRSGTGGPADVARTSGPAGRNRLAGVDVARCIALLGMMAVHVLPSETPAGSPTTSFFLAGGRSAAAFAVLAGVGLALWTGGDRPRRPAGTVSALVIRALAIGAIGALLELADSGLAVILPYYAMLFLFAIPLLWLSARTLVVLAVAVAVVMPVISHLVRPGLPGMGEGHLLAELTITGYYPTLAWLTYLCAGIAAGRLALRSTRAAFALLGGGVLLAVVAKATSWWLLEVVGGRERIAADYDVSPDVPELERRLTTSNFGATPTGSWWWLASSAPHSTTTFDLLHTTGTALALLGACLLASRLLPRLLIPLAAAGSIPLTLYSAHVLVVRSPLVPDDPELSYAWQVGMALVLATLWRSTGRRGPLEALVAFLSNLARGTPRRPNG